MLLGIEAFRGINSNPEARLISINKKLEVVKPKKESNILDLEPKARKALADSLINKALKDLDTFKAEDMAVVTKLTVSCVRNKLNKLFDKGEVTKIKVNDGRPGGWVFYFKLVA